MSTPTVPGTPKSGSQAAVSEASLAQLHATAELDAPFAPAPEADDPRRGREVFAPAEGSFEAPAKEFVPGPYYMGIDEVMPEVAERPVDQDTTTPGSRYSVDRRDFMKLFSVTSMAAATACVRRPLEKAVPYVDQPIDQWPGEPTFYATTCGECAAGCGMMVKTREGRPVKIEGLPGHPVNNGKMCNVGQSSLQGLYHPDRRKQPMIKFGQRYDRVSWDDVYAHLGSRMANLSRIGILTNGSTGHRHAFFKEFLEKIGSNGSRLYTYESNSLMEAVTAAHQIAFGVQAMPRADLHKAKTIVGIGADFLDIGYSQLFHYRGYTEAHGYNSGQKNRHVQFEADHTITGARSDERHPIPPGSETLVTLLLTKALLEHSGSKGSGAARAQISQALEQKADLIAGGYDRVGIKREVFDALAAELLTGASVVMAGGLSFDENATNLQLAAIMANQLLGAYDNVLHLQKGWMTPPVVSGDLQRFLAEAEQLELLFVIDVDPTFTLPTSWGVQELLRKVPMLVSMQSHPAEIDRMAHYVLNTNHFLESWGDEQPVAGFWSLRQPTVRITTDSRQTEDALMWLAASAKKPLGYEDYRDFLTKKWAAIHQVAGSGADFDAFFNSSVQKGFVDRIATQAVGEVSGQLAANFKYVDAGPGGNLRLLAPLDHRLHDGRYAHRPVLQEQQHALTTIVWDTWVAMNPTTMQKLGFRQNDVVKVEGPAGSFEAAVYPLPGLHPDAVVVPRGNGHAKDMGLVEGGNGVNPLTVLARAADTVTGAPVTAGQAVKLTRTGTVHMLAAVQKKNDIANRTDIVKKVGLKTAQANIGKTKDLDKVPNLYPAIPAQDYKWGMAIDLAKCTGCGACQVACSIENNVPQVGREQILKGREMYWIRIDRYFYGSTDQPTVTMQPMLCQHCNHAPCEAVCPVYATTHDPEGVNQMTYNRCIGTRYCANACPYKIRRFNWWTHKWGVIGERPVDRNPRAMNPDVTVRTRGVMEKCHFCYQRVRDAKHRVKIRKTPLVDGELQMACQQTCPADAINFGNLMDPESRITQQRKDYRAYLALGGDPEHGHYGLKTLPSVNYMADVTLVEQPAAHGSGHGDGHGSGTGDGHHG